MIDLKPRLKNHYRAHRLSFWLNLVPDLHKPGGDDVPNSHHDLENDDVVMPVLPTVKPLNPPAEKLNRTLTTNPIFSLLNLNATHSNRSTVTRQIPAAGDTDMSDDFGQQGTSSPQEDGFAAYSTALSVTIAIGCSLLILNVLIFAGVYYQRDKTRLNEPTHITHAKKRNENGQMPNNICGDLETLTIHTKSDAANTLLAHHHALQHHQQHHPPPEFADIPQRAPPPPKHLKSSQDTTSMLPPHSIVAIGTNCGTLTKKNCSKSNLSSSQPQNTIMMDELRV